VISVVISFIGLIVILLSADISLTLFINAIINGGVGIITFISLILLTGLQIMAIKVGIKYVRGVLIEYKHKNY
jgi:hypothetical protein